MTRPLVAAIAFAALLPAPAPAAAPDGEAPPWTPALVAAADACVPGEPAFAERTDAWTRDAERHREDEARWAARAQEIEAGGRVLAGDTESVRDTRAALRSREQSLVRQRDRLAQPATGDAAARHRAALAEQYNRDVRSHNEAVSAFNARLDALDARRRAHAAAQGEAAARRAELDRRSDALLAAAAALSQLMRRAAAQCSAPAAELHDAPTGQ